MSTTRGTGGNRFIPGDATRADLMRSINDQLGDLHEWAEWSERKVDIGALTIETRRIKSGAISVSVTGDLTPAADHPTPTPSHATDAQAKEDQ